MQLRKMLKNEMLLHFLVVLQWVIFVASVAFNTNFSIAVTGATANGGIKAIMFFQTWMLLFSAAACLPFYWLRKRGATEKLLLGLSALTTLFSIANISLHFVNNAVLLMQVAELAAWTFYNSAFAVSMYKISNVLLLPLFKSQVNVEEETNRNNREVVA